MDRLKSRPLFPGLFWLTVFLGLALAGGTLFTITSEEIASHLSRRSFAVAVKPAGGGQSSELFEWNAIDQEVALEEPRVYGAVGWPPENFSALLAEARKFGAAHDLREPAACAADPAECIATKIAEKMLAVGKEPVKLTLEAEGSLLTTRLEVGRGTYGLPNLCVWHYSEPDVKLVIGQFVSIAMGLNVVLDGGHDTRRMSLYPFKGETFANATKGSVRIGNDVWIGLHVLILSGVTIGDGAVVGAGSVVAKDVAPYSVVVGNPARAVRSRFPPHEVKRLLALQWWDWSGEEILRRQPELTAELTADVVGTALETEGG